jgi:hypothetical protein
MRTLTMLMTLSVSTAATSAEPPSPYAPLEFLAGHCWKGTLPSGRGEDTHCFTHIYDSHFVRDKHTVHAASQPDYLGESIYYWDSVAKQLKYLYVESDGGSSAGAVSGSAEALVFPPTEYQQDGKTQVYRSRWKKNGEDAYEVVTEFKNGNDWKPGWSVHMEKVAQK